MFGQYHSCQQSKKKKVFQICSLEVLLCSLALNIMYGKNLELSDSMSSPALSQLQPIALHFPSTSLQELEQTYASSF